MDGDLTARAEELLDDVDGCAKKLASGLPGLAAPLKAQARERARRMFVFVILSVLLEDRQGRKPADKALAEELEKLFAKEIVSARQGLRAISKKALTPDQAADFAKKLDGDPFAAYYGSFDKMRADPHQGPFGILAREIPDASYEEVFGLAAVLSDELVARL